MFWCKSLVTALISYNYNCLVSFFQLGVIFFWRKRRTVVLNAFSMWIWMPVWRFYSESYLTILANCPWYFNDLTAPIATKLHIKIVTLNIIIYLTYMPSCVHGTQLNSLVIYPRTYLPIWSHLFTIRHYCNCFPVW